MALTPNQAFIDDFVGDEATALVGQSVAVLDAANVTLGAVAVPNGGFEPVVAGETSLTATLSLPVTTPGTAAKIRIYRSATGYTSGTVGLTGSGSDLELPRVDLVEGDSIDLTSFIVRLVA